MNRETQTYYSAFISYKHEKRDTAAAAAIQKGLEHFHVPRAIREQTGQKNLGRIFRDKEEMSLTSDLSEEIKGALKNSAFLIVICSLHTRESIWVEREITFFLQTHGPDHVLTVLTEGEPEEVLPLILLRPDTEPLSADYRLPKRTAQKSELPRIAAALLGCRYDDLVRRSRQYRMQRLVFASFGIAVLSAAAALYLLWSRSQISRSLHQAQISQAKYLAGEVESLLEEDYDVTAAQLALYTVPEDRSQTPPQSWRALTDASWAYIPQTVEVSANTKVIGELKSSTNIRIFRENKARSQICTTDATNHIHVWDAEKCRDILSFQNPEEVQDLILIGDRLIVGDTKQMSGYDLATGKAVWTLDRKTSQLQTDQKENKIIAITINERGENFLSVLDPEDGTLRSDILISNSEENYRNSMDLTVADSGECAAFCTSSIDSELWSIRICDLTDGQLMETSVRLYSVYELSFLKDGSLLVRGITDKETFLENGANNGTSFYGLMTTIGDTADSVYCISAESGETQWISDLKYNQYDQGLVNADSFTYADENGNLRDAVYAIAGNIFQVYDAQTGEKIQRWELSDEIAFIGIPSGNASGQANSLIAICCDGAANRIVMGEKDIHCMALLKEDIGKVFYYSVSEDDYGYFVRDGNRILQYTAATYSDPDFAALQGSDEEGRALYVTMTEDTYVVVRETTETDGTSDKETILEAYDRTERTLRSSFPLQKGLSLRKHYFGLTQDEQELVYTDYFDTGIFAVSLTDDKTRKLPIPVERTGSNEEETLFNPYTGRKMILQEDHIYYVSEAGNFCIYDMKAGETADSENETEVIRSFPCNTEENSDAASAASTASVCALSVSPGAQYAFVSFDTGTSVLLNLQEEAACSVIKTQAPLYSNAQSASGAVSWDLSQNRFAVAGEREVLLCSTDGTILQEMTYGSTQAVGLTFYEDMLLVAYTDGRLNRYALSDGKILGSAEVGVYSATSAADDESCWSFRDDGTLYLTLSNYVSVIDTEEWSMRYSVPNCELYDPENKIFLVYAEPSSDKTILGYFPEYTLDDLMEKCRKAAGNQDLDEETLAGYGLE